MKKPYTIQDRTFDFSREIIKLYEQLYDSFSASGSLSNRLLQSGTSIGSHLEEADPVKSRQDFIAGCSLALDDAKKTHYWLRLFEAESLASREKLLPLLLECEEIMTILTAIVNNSRLNSDQ